MIHTSSSARVERQKEVVSLEPPVQREVPELSRAEKVKQVIVLGLPGEATKTTQETTSEAPGIPPLTQVGKLPEGSVPPLQKVEPIDPNELPQLQKVEVVPKIPEIVQVTATAEEIPKLVETRTDTEPGTMVINKPLGKRYRVMRKFDETEAGGEYRWTDDMGDTLGLIGQAGENQPAVRVSSVSLLLDDGRSFTYPLVALQEVFDGEGFDIKEIADEKQRTPPKLTVLGKKSEDPVIKAIPVSYLLFMYDWETEEIYFITTISNRDAFVESCKKEITHWVKSKTGDNGSIYGGAIHAMKVPKELSELNITKIYNLRGELDSSTPTRLNHAIEEESEVGVLIRSDEEDRVGGNLLSSWVLVTAPADVTFNIPMKAITESLHDALSD